MELEFQAQNFIIIDEKFLAQLIRWWELIHEKLKCSPYNRNKIMNKFESFVVGPLSPHGSCVSLLALWQVSSHCKNKGFMVYQYWELMALEQEAKHCGCQVECSATITLKYLTSPKHTRLHHNKKLDRVPKRSDIINTDLEVGSLLGSTSEVM